MTSVASTVKRVRIDRALAAQSVSPVFLGAVATQGLVSDGEADLLRVTAVTFEDGARNRWHRHTTDQVLVGIEGAGIVAIEGEELPFGPGEIVLIPAGERHWHGARPGQSFTHLSIVTPGHMDIDE